MELEGLEVWLIIILVLGVIASNLAVLKYSAKFKMPQFGEPKKPEDANNTTPTSHEAGAKPIEGAKPVEGSKPVDESAQQSAAIADKKPQPSDNNMSDKD